jgi:hypothetical protein
MVKARGMKPSVRERGVVITSWCRRIGRIGLPRPGREHGQIRQLVPLDRPASLLVSADLASKFRIRTS